MEIGLLSDRLSLHVLLSPSTVCDNSDSCIHVVDFSRHSFIFLYSISYQILKYGMFSYLKTLTIYGMWLAFPLIVKPRFKN